MPDSDIGGGGGCCRCCCSFLITSGLTALFMWLSLRTSKPTCSIEHLYLPALNTSAGDNHTISFDLKLANSMKDKGVHYANISLTFFYLNSSSSSTAAAAAAAVAVANYTVPAFYQGHKKSARRRALVAAPAVPWAAAIAAVRNGSAVAFKVRVATRVKFKIMFWYTKRYRLEVAEDVKVDATGSKVNKKGVKLKSAAAGIRRWLEVGPAVVFAFYFIVLFL